MLRDDRLNDSEIKLLLLGAGESGKSTLFKQIRIIHDGGYNEHELLGFVDTIHSNVLQSMQALIQASHDLNIPIENPENRQKAAKILELQNDSLLNINKVYNEAFANDLKDLWEDAGIQTVYKRRNEFQLLDSTEYFYTNLKRISQKDYVPNQQDVLHCRIKTTGVVQLRFEIDELKMLLIDVGGQRNERKKWIHCFDDVTAIIFVASLSEFDQKCYEDDSTNRLDESILLFDEIVNSHFFEKTPVILFLNKSDLFSKKLNERGVFKRVFPEFEGDDTNLRQCADHIKDKFISRVEDKDEKKIDVRITCATDTEAIKTVFDNVKEAIVKNTVIGKNNF
ncbi:predicted protein [Naegleria gruberi]|uniref:Predicted protein n=1 Tax=Naegleria gruberi TaxID=5762 RepID=D2W0X6_NAEGR|nr:uncharacterized protein NAEGRDRAFT_44850 [Naegleria gruberi]EFC37220.1 predicted protein [Naegleria gruberi]|eukprot:XP_002669964.1 predicted protein [Naegleria gruberi strain NEG-M]